jgi:hypothetical protein
MVAIRGSIIFKAIYYMFEINSLNNFFNFINIFIIISYQWETFSIHLWTINILNDSNKLKYIFEDIKRRLHSWNACCHTVQSGLDILYIHIVIFWVLVNEYLANYGLQVVKRLSIEHVNCYAL